MQGYTRKQFIKSSSLLLAGSMASSTLFTKKVKPKLSFSTLGCPDWDFKKIIQFAAGNNYNALEMRGLLRELDLTKCKEFTKAQLPETLRLMKQNNLSFVNLGSSANLHIAEPIERKKNLDGGRRFIDLAVEMHCPFIRVYPNNFPKDQDKNETINLIAKGLIELGEHANGSSVRVLMETHGDLVKSDDLLQIMQAANGRHTGLIWDISNMWSVTKEPVEDVYKKLENYIFHTHIKDAVIKEETPHYVFLGRGEIPIFKAIDLLNKNNYKGFYSFEWEKLWHPEIAEPELALADYSKVMRQYFSSGSLPVKQ